MMSPIGRKLGKVVYYARNFARDAAPQTLFRGRLGRRLAEATSGDVAEIRRRANYYNKLPANGVSTPFTARVDTISMERTIYYYDLKEHARYFSRALQMNYVFGDVIDVPEHPSLVKSRPIDGDNGNSVIMKLEKFRHFYFPADRTPFADKRPMAVWRGGGHNAKRRALVDGHHGHPLCDVGLTDRTAAADRRKEFLTPAEQMRFKYIISIEGYDVATNLKWILASRSLCIMPRPRFETWFMEGRLEAGRHYVEVRDDFADLEEKILHYEGHVADALSIIRNANAYVAQFRDARRERLLSLLVLYKYFAATGQIDADPRLAAIMEFAGAETPGVPAS